MLGELKREEMEALLKSELTGRIGCHADGRTYVVPITYVYEDGFVYGHTGDGLKVRLMRKNPEVCFEVDHMDDLTRWRSVIIQGRYTELQREEASKAMTLLFERLSPKATRPPHGIPGLTPEMDRAVGDGRHGVVFRIHADEMTGRFEEH